MKPRLAHIAILVLAAQLNAVGAPLASACLDVPVPNNE